MRDRGREAFESLPLVSVFDEIARRAQVLRLGVVPALKSEGAETARGMAREIFHVFRQIEDLYLAQEGLLQEPTSPRETPDECT